MVEITGASWPGDLIVAKAGAFVRDGDRITPVKKTDTAADVARDQPSEGLDMNFSAWAFASIAPSRIRVAEILSAFSPFLTWPITRFPNIDVRRLRSPVVQSGAAPSELEAAGQPSKLMLLAGITC